MIDSGKITKRVALSLVRQQIEDFSLALDIFYPLVSTKLAFFGGLLLFALFLALLFNVLGGCCRKQLQETGNTVIVDMVAAANFRQYDFAVVFLEFVQPLDLGLDTLVEIFRLFFEFELSDAISNVQKLLLSHLKDCSFIRACICHCIADV
jgi:hypothetical protein